MRETIHFAHGNGFPSPCYRQLIQQLEKRFNCCYIDRVGHTSQFPVTENWQRLIEEVIFSIQSQALQPVIAVGHSLGGVLSLLAAIEQPSLFKAVILLDSPLINRFKSSVVRFSKALGMIDRLTPAFRTRARRQHILHEYESRLSVPATLIYGNKSNIVDRMDMRYMKKHYGIETVKTNGTHMFPFETPETTANLIMGLVDRLL